jgi:hypothetical protein
MASNAGIEDVQDPMHVCRLQLHCHSREMNLLLKIVAEVPSGEFPWQPDMWAL